MDAMATEITSHVANPYPNKVIHADIRIQSIDDESGPSGPAIQSDERLGESKPSIADVVYQEKAADMRECWSKAIAKNMDLPEGYSSAAVLIIRWADALDDLKTGVEARELNALFRERYHYKSNIVELDVQTKPQHQLESSVINFIRDNDGPENLLIVYYTGHGDYSEERKCLELTGSLRPNNVLLGRGFRKNARANWTKAEDRLRSEDVESDVLTILDTCYASNFAKSGREGQKKFELLSACAIDQLAEPPGDKSYTRALIDALKELHTTDTEGAISTFRLHQRINMDERRKDTPSQIWSRGKSTQHSDQHIVLAPLKLGTVNTSNWRPKPKGYLTLRFGLRDSTLSPEQIDFMTKNLAKAFGNKALVGLRRVDWVDIELAPPTTDFERVTFTYRAIAQWRRVVEKNKKMRGSPLVPKTGSVGASQKRTNEDADDLPEAKRRYLDTSQPPPSPPVSESSRID
ncbi:uncharacterized protein J4E79_003151 [Alternaria viburni]|uniref:uncharacterized protein n=1 Tax=Alternaria viburni TaxID=566460 RepID=UPI0020C565D9|nr:uncharacterized protein J4E79_003151 [Alternaria viburni]KAI4664853.1 hypothetical protein J4E79_003151 [Alternaria viburni]